VLFIFRVFVIAFLGATDTNITVNPIYALLCCLCNYRVKTLISCNLGDIRHRLRLSPFHIPAIPFSGGNIFIDAVIALDQFCKPQIPEFTVGFG